MERCSSHCIARLFVNLPSVCLEHCFILAQVCPRSWSYGQRADPSLAMCDIDADDVDEEEADEEQSDGTEGAGAEGQGRGRSRGKRKLRGFDAAGKKAKERVGVLRRLSLIGRRRNGRQQKNGSFSILLLRPRLQDFSRRSFC